MKKILTAIICICFFAAPMAQAQSDDAPRMIQDSFKAKYPNVQVKDWDWEGDIDMYEAEFVMNGREHEAYFTPDGQWVKTKSKLKDKQVPRTVSSGLSKSEYNNWKADDYYEMDTPEGKHFKAKVKSGGLEYHIKMDEKGNVLESKTKDEIKMEKKEMKDETMKHDMKKDHMNQEIRDDKMLQEEPVHHEMKK